jgi:hypothetical protein
MKYQISRHIEAQVDSQESDKVLLENLYHRTRMLSDDAIWDVLRRYEKPSKLGDSPLEARAVQAKLIEPVDQQEFPRQLRSRFDEVSAKVLKYRKVEADPDLDIRLTQLAETCKPITSNKPIDYFIWQDPALVFKVMLEHFRVYLNTEFTASHTSTVRTEFLAKSLGRPPRQATLEQQICTLDTAWRRAERIAQDMAPEGRVLILGDDDLVSLALSCFPVGVSDVLELDSLLVRLLRKRGGDRLRVLRRDLANGLSSEFTGVYDVVVSDPMYSKEGMDMFLDCCTNGLKPGPESRLYLTTYPPLLEDPDGFFSLLESKGLEVLETTEHFSRYPFPKEMRDGALKGLNALGYHPKLCRVLLEVPYLYAHLFECRLKTS